MYEIIWQNGASIKIVDGAKTLLEAREKIILGRLSFTGGKLFYRKVG